MIDVFSPQLHLLPPWSCVRTTLVWPLTSVLWGMSRPTTSPSSSGHLSLTLLWVNLFFPMQQINCFTFVNPYWIYFLLSGAWLLWHIHSETAPVYISSQPGVHHPCCLQSQRASHLRHGHPLSAGELILSNRKNVKVYWFLQRNVVSKLGSHWHQNKNVIFKTHAKLCYLSWNTHYFSCTDGNPEFNTYYLDSANYLEYVNMNLYES